jgi:formate dehydrogenase subunit gamma
MNGTQKFGSLKNFNTIPSPENLKHTIATAEAGEVHFERLFYRFTLGQRLEHAILVLSFTVLLITGLPQKYYKSWGHFFLRTPESILTVRQIHLFAAIVLILEVVYHVGHGILLLARRQLTSSIFPSWQDVRDAWQMVKYLLFLTNEKPAFGKYSFEQKFTYWFIFFSVGIMVITGFVLWFPMLWTRFISGGVIPAARIAHSSEAVAAGIFVLVWHLYHVLVERLNLSIITGWLGEKDMRTYHPLEYRRLAKVPGGDNNTTDGEQDH